MNKQISISNKRIIFSRWSRKSFAIFASLNKVVNIAKLTIDICLSSLTKNKSALRSLKEQQQLLLSELKSEDEKLLNTDWLTAILIELGLIKLDGPCGSSLNIFSNNESPYNA